MSALQKLGSMVGSYLTYSRADPRKSARKSAEVVALDIQRSLRDPKFIARAIDIAFPAPSQTAQCELVSRFAGVNPETVRRWIHGITRPNLEDFMPILFMVFQKRAGDQAYHRIAEVIGDV